MDREIKFRAYSTKTKEMYYLNPYSKKRFGGTDLVEEDWWKLMQYTGLKDKKNLQEIYEDDIIDIDGNLIGNKYENSNLLKEKTNFVIQGLGTKTWCSTYQKAMERGCKNS